MLHVNYTTTSPEVNLAIDELMLNKAESGVIGESLRFWMSEEYFVVLGRACRISEECLIDACERDAIKILRRPSGGGTILQGPGSVNYSAVLSYDRDEGLRNVTGSYGIILGGIIRGFKQSGHELEFFPTSDLALDGKKISGNAQKRGKKYILHHGTFLLDFDLDKISKYLDHPPKEPEYRAHRKHSDFLANIGLGYDEFKDIISKCFSDAYKELQLSEEDITEINKLVVGKYSAEEWNCAL